MSFSILAMGGDGIGEEVLQNGIRLLDVVAACFDLDLEISEDYLGVATYDRFGAFCG